MIVEEYFGIKADLEKDKPTNVANILRVVANEIETAPQNRRYDVNLQTKEYVVETEDSETEDSNDEIQALRAEIKSLKQELESEKERADEADTNGQSGVVVDESDLSELNYNELKRIASENDLDVGMNPQKQTLISEISSAEIDVT